MPILSVPIQTGGGGVVTPPGGGGGTVDPGTGGGGVVVNPSDGGVVVPPSSPQPVVQSSSLTLTTYDGTVFDLTNGDRYLATLGRRGFDAATYVVFADQSPMVDGEVFRSARAQPRDLTLPIYIRGDTRQQFLDRKRDLLARLSPMRGLATLQVAEADGSRRHIACYLTGGAEGNAARDQSGRNWTRYELALRCPEPFWKGDAIRVEFQAPSAALWLGNSTFLPVRVQSSQSFGAAAFVNPGDTLSSPVWSVFGPTSGGITLTRDATPYLPAETLVLNSTLIAGQSVVIDTRSAFLTITDNAGANRWPDLADGSSLWQIAPGENLIHVAVGGATTATRVVLDAEPRYETA
jgi:hypothetical protein